MIPRRLVHGLVTACGLRTRSTGPPGPRSAGLRIMLPLLAELATTSLLLPGAPQHLLPPNLQMRDHWSPMWHQQDRSHLAAGDVNAFFYFRGVWHLMTQWEMEVPNTDGPQPKTLPIVGWGHSVSTDLLQFHRIAPALVPGPPSTTMEGCYEGSISFVHKGGDASQPLTPMLMADGACGELSDPEPTPNKRPPGGGCTESFGYSSGGTLAFPADLNDPNLTVWEKEGPVHYEHCGPGGGPSSVWQPQPGVWNVMLRANGSAGGRVRLVTVAGWRLANPFGPPPPPPLLKTDDKLSAYQDTDACQDTDAQHCGASGGADPQELQPTTSTDGRQKMRLLVIRTHRCASTAFGGWILRAVHASHGRLEAYRAEDGEVARTGVTLRDSVGRPC